MLPIDRNMYKLHSNTKFNNIKELDSMAPNASHQVNVKLHEITKLYKKNVINSYPKVLYSINITTKQKLVTKNINIPSYS